MKISVDQIRTDGGTQSRAVLDNAVIEEYANAMLEGAQFPPITVFYDGQEHWLADGFHRFEARCFNEESEVECEVLQGTVRDAILYSIGANQAHGMRRTNEDKRRAVVRLLQDTEWGAWSDREIAKRAGVSNTFVGTLRSICQPLTDTGERKVERNGVTYTVNTANIGKGNGDHDTEEEHDTDASRGGGEEEYEEGDDLEEGDGRGEVVEEIARMLEEDGYEVAKTRTADKSQGGDKSQAVAPAPAAEPRGTESTPAARPGTGQAPAPSVQAPADVCPKCGVRPSAFLFDKKRNGWKCGQCGTLVDLIVTRSKKAKVAGESQYCTACGEVVHGAVCSNCGEVMR